MENLESEPKNYSQEVARQASALAKLYDQATDPDGPLFSSFLALATHCFNPTAYPIPTVFRWNNMAGPAPELADCFTATSVTELTKKALAFVIESNDSELRNLSRFLHTIKSWNEA